MNPGTDTAPPTPDDVLSRIDELIPRLRERAEETESLRRIPESSIEELKDAGVFHLLSPMAVGGFGMGAGTYAQAIRRLAQGCASTAWTAGHLIEHVWMLARWPREVQDEVFANGPAPLAAAAGAPVGAAERVPGGYAISGLWSFASGVMHSGWALLAAQHGTMRLQCLVPISDVEVLDVWHTAGLRGTGSNDVRAEKLFVPEYRALVRKVKNTLDNRQTDSPIAQARFAQASGLVVTARLHWEEAIKVVSAANERQPSLLTDEERARYRLSLTLSGEASADAVRLIMAGSGGSAQRLSHPLQRIQRATYCSTTQHWRWIRSLSRQAAACWV